MTIKKPITAMQWVGHRAILSIACLFLMFANIATSSAQSVVTLVNLDGPGEGFNSNSAPFANQTGNNGATLGQQRLNVFQAAADYWEERIVSSVPIRVAINMDPLTCNAGSATLGSAGPEDVFRDFANAPLANTWYVAAVANSLVGTDLDTNNNDIGARFNSAIDNNNNCLSGTNWWLGINSEAPPGTISLFDTVLHEIGHGLGVLTLVSQSGVRFDNRNDAYMHQLFDEQTNTFWRNMNNAQRATSSTNTGNLVWRGANADTNSGHLTAGKTGGHIRMYAPSPFRLGSSVSHWDTALTPDELMEPFATDVSDDTSTIQLLKDVGWNIVEGPGEIGFQTSSIRVFEDRSPATIRVQRTGGSSGAVSVTFNTSNITAIGGGIDYSSIVNQTLNWADGEVGVKTIDIDIVDDEIEEDGGETALLSLSNATGGATIALDTATLTIRDPVLNDDDILLLTVPAIAAASNKTPPPPPPNPQWLVVNEVCCPTSSATFSVTQGSNSRSSTAPSCSVPAPTSSAVTSTPGNKAFSFRLTSSGCGVISDSFNFSFQAATRYFFVAQLEGSSVNVNVFSQPIANLSASQQSVAPATTDGMTLEQTVILPRAFSSSQENSEANFRSID